MDFLSWDSRSPVFKASMVRPSFKEISMTDPTPADKEATAEKVAQEADASNLKKAELAKAVRDAINAEREFLVTGLTPEEIKAAESKREQDAAATAKASPPPQPAGT